MPSRRAVLSSLAVGSIGVAGCTVLGAATGYVQWKAVEGFRSDGSSDIVLEASYDGDGTTTGHVSGKWSEYVGGPPGFTVTESFHDELRRTYGDFRFAISVCSEKWESTGATGCRNGDTDLESFNRVLVGDRVRASYRDDDERIEIHDIVDPLPNPDPE